MNIVIIPKPEKKADPSLAASVTLSRFLPGQDPINAEDPATHFPAIADRIYELHMIEQELMEKQPAALRLKLRDAKVLRRLHPEVEMLEVEEIVFRHHGREIIDRVERGQSLDTVTEAEAFMILRTRLLQGGMTELEHAMYAHLYARIAGEKRMTCVLGPLFRRAYEATAWQEVETRIRRIPKVMLAKPVQP